MHGSLARRLFMIAVMVVMPLTVVVPTVAAPAPCADLVVTAFSITPTTPTAGQLATIHITVANQGTCGTDVGFTVQWKQTQFAQSGPSANFGPLLNGTSESQDLDYTFSKGGDFLSVVTIDTDHVVPETNETNNVDIFSVSVDPATTDLVIDSFVVAPNPVGQLLDATATIDISNNGNTDSDAFQVAWYPTTSTSPVTMNVPGLAAGNSTSVVLDFGYPDLGTYASIAVVDATHQVKETNEFNNFAVTLETVIPALSDLQVTDVAFTPASPIAGQNVHVTVTVQNFGNTSTDSSFAVQWKPKPFGVVPLSTQIGPLDVGDSTTAEFDYTYPSDGTFNTTATVDSNNVIYELNEGNNTFTKPIIVTPSNVDLLITDVTVNPATPEQGVDATVDITVQNLGNSDAGPFKVSWNPDSTGLKVPSSATVTLQVNSLAAGDSTILSFSFNYPEAGDFHTVATVDAFKEIKETNETNNLYLKDLTVDPGNINLIITQFTWTPVSPKRFQQVTATIKVKNTGTITAGTFKVQWKLIDTNQSGPSTFVKGLHPGEETTVTLKGTYFQPGDYTTEAIVDSTDVIPEPGNEGDNTSSKPITVQPLT